MVYASETQSALSGWTGRFQSRLADLQERFEKYRHYRKTVTELKSLSIRELNDLGMSPANIHAVAYEAVYKA